MGNRLLLADDSITIQKVVAIIFANEELFELTVVDNGIAALEKAREMRPDVMLVDALMPGKSGYEVCAEIRRDPALAGTPVLLLIGAFEPFDEAKARECGADSSITKPFESQQLIDRVKELLELGKNRPSAPVAAPAAAAPAAAAVDAAAAEELWGDLSSLDVSAPAAPAAASQPISEAEAFFAAPVAPEPVAAAPQAPPAAAAAAPAAAPAAAFEAVLEATPDDDLWGAFDLEEIPTPAAAPAEPVQVGVVEPQFEAELFSFEDDEDVLETGPALDLDSVVTPMEQPSPEQLFSLGDLDQPAPSAAQPDPFNFPAEEPFSFEPEVTAPTEAVSAPVETVAPQAAPPEPQPEFVAAAVCEPVPAPAAQAAPAAGPATLSEADLVAALSKVSREVIERIVWEVVPDLAEVIIKEEIRKLKAGIKE
ncbi:response regulator [Geomonas limicola]|uniref:Response regulator n=1 Tax=Geomonas limicola TaxID=2740186 RepID=A0A6V8N5F6_9BACT|nr:response regulator [Geomonas limicola]GFO66853.1 response regulator [Geomonas limicola]